MVIRQPNELGAHLRRVHGGCGPGSADDAEAAVGDLAGAFPPPFPPPMNGEGHCGNAIVPQIGGRPRDKPEQHSRRRRRRRHHTHLTSVALQLCVE